MKKDGDQLDSYLRGETPLEELPERLRIEEERLRGLIGTLREDVRAPLALHDAVMRAVALVQPPFWRRLTDWCLRPRTVRLSPAGGALALAASAAVFLLWPGSAPTSGPAVGEGPAFWELSG